MRKNIEQQIAETQQRLSRLQHKKKDMSRKADAHAKIMLGGVVIASGCGDFDPAELCGWLLLAREKRTDGLAAQAKERGLRHFEARNQKASD